MPSARGRGRPRKDEETLPLNPQWQVKKVTPIVREVLLLKASGLTHKEIASTLDRTPQWVGLVCRSPLFKLELKRLQQKLEGTFVDIKKEAMQVDAEVGVLRRLGELVEKADTDSVRVSAAREILDRAYGKPVQHVEATVGFKIPDKFLQNATEAFLQEPIDVEAQT